MDNFGLSGNSVNSFSPQFDRNLHKFIQEQNKVMIEKVKNFVQIQTELMEFRIFLSLHADRKEMDNIIKATRKYKKDQWEKLLKKANGNVEKAMDYYYQ